MVIIDKLIYKFKKWNLKRKRKAIVIRGSCVMCGSCCKGICLYIEGKWLSSKRGYKKALKQAPYIDRFKITGKTPSGYLEFACECLGEDNKCSDYKNRPQLCKSFPQPSIFLQNGKLPSSCGFRMSTETDFELILEQALQDTKSDRKAVE